MQKKRKKVKKPLVLLWKIVKKSKNHYKTKLKPKKRVVKPISSHGFGPWNSNTRLDKLWGTLTDKLFREKTIVLLCFRSKMLKNNWFYCVFAQKCWKTIGFIVFSLTNVEKAFVLLCFWGLGLRKHWIYSHFIGFLFNKLRF